MFSCLDPAFLFHSPAIVLLLRSQWLQQKMATFPLLCPSQAWHLFWLLFSFLFLARYVQSQHQTFSWSVDNAEIRECDSVPIRLGPEPQASSLEAYAPFYMISYEVGGAVNTEYLGENGQNLRWTVRHHQGTQLFMNVVDSAENTGGILVDTVQGGRTGSCLPKKPHSSLEIVADFSQVATCDSVNATIYGGVPPYTISVIPARKYHFPFNITMDKAYDTFTYVNRFPPGDSFLVAASDSSREWARGTTLVHSVGSRNMSCPEKQSYGSHSANATRTGHKKNSSPASKYSSSRPLSVVAIAGIAVGGFTATVLAILSVYFLVRRRRGRSPTNRRFLPPDDGLTPLMLQTRMSALSNVRRPSIASAFSNGAVLSSPFSPDPSRQGTTMPLPFRSRYDVGTFDALALSPEARQMPKNALFFEDEGRSPLLAHGTSMDRLSGFVGNLSSAPAMGSEKRWPTLYEGVTLPAAFQHDDSEDIIEIPPAYRER